MMADSDQELVGPPVEAIVEAILEGIGWYQRLLESDYESTDDDSVGLPVVAAPMNNVQQDVGQVLEDDDKSTDDDSVGLAVVPVPCNASWPDTLVGYQRLIESDDESTDDDSVG